MKINIFIAAAVIAAAFSGISAAAVDEADISAKAAVVYQPDTEQVLFSKNMDQRLPMASTTKIMTTLLLLESCDDLDEQFVVNSDAIKVEGSSMGLREGDIVTPRALCIGMLLPSGNDAANASAVYVSGSIEEFARLMNLRADALGMRNSHFVTPSGLHDEEHYSSAYDMALLTAEAMENPVFAEICGSSSMQLEFGSPPFKRWLKNTNRLLGMCEGCIGVKTGFTDEAGRCLVSACERDGVRLISVTLSDRNDWNDHIALYEDSFSRIRPVEIDAGEFSVPVCGSGCERIMLKCDGTVIYPSIDGKSPEIQCRTVMPSFLYAPVEKGSTVGRAEFFADGVMFAECGLYAAESAQYEEVPAAEASLIDRLIGFFKELFGF